ncbi:MAG: MarR family winged helix-turn-helix transcriptional regulator [Xenococcaceae cyanobacterium]
MGTHYSGTETEVRALNAFIKLIRAAESVSGRVNRHLDEVNLTVSQFGVLEALLHLGPMCQKDLAQRLLKTGGNLTLVIDNLEKRQLVKRERDSSDRRQIYVHLTRSGEELINNIFPRHVAAVVKDLKILNPLEQEQLDRLCRKLGQQERD